MADMVELKLLPRASRHDLVRESNEEHLNPFSEWGNATCDATAAVGVGGTWRRWTIDAGLSPIIGSLSH